MKFSPGENVVKVPCPAGCTCDGSAIPNGTLGQIDPAYKRRGLAGPGGGTEIYYTVSWVVKGRKTLWGTYEHGIESFDHATFPDISYLEGV